MERWRAHPKGSCSAESCLNFLNYDTCWDCSTGRKRREILLRPHEYKLPFRQSFGVFADIQCVVRNYIPPHPISRFLVYKKGIRRRAVAPHDTVTGRTLDRKSWGILPTRLLYKLPPHSAQKCCPPTSQFGPRNDIYPLEGPTHYEYN